MGAGRKAKGAAAGGVADAELTARVRGRNPAAEAELAARYRPGLVVMLRHRVGDEAEDLAQETLRLALEKIRAGQLRAPDRLASFLRGIAANLARHSHRSRARGRPAQIEADALPAARPAADEELLARERLGAVRRALACLSQRDQRVLRGFYLEEDDKSVICRREGLTPAQFDLVKYRALRRLRKILGTTTDERSSA